jgi:4-hydroxy-3-methylbut-2-enyl diphosphate reductase
MKVIEVKPQGYCGGVKNAIDLAKKTRKLFPKKKVYIYGHLVHNSHVTEALKSIDIITLERTNHLQELLQSIPTGIIITTAHGTKDSEVTMMRQSGFEVIDGTCPFVLRTRKILIEALKNQQTIIYIGKKGHPESEAMVSLNPKSIYLIENINDIENLVIDKNISLTVTNQTTMSQHDINPLFESIKTRYPQAQMLDEICNATRARQAALEEELPKGDLVVIVGDPKSNNTRKLAEIAERSRLPVYFVSGADQLSKAMLLSKNKVAVVTSGASTPPAITRQVIDFIASDGKVTSETNPKDILY